MNTSTTPAISRRRLAQGVAWSVPAVAVVAATPAVAASANCTNGTILGSYTAPVPGTTATSNAAVSTDWTVPAGIWAVCYTVIGGGGGGSGSTRQGGSAAKITGTIAVTPGETLTLIVAAGGVRRTGNVSATGGGGYGTGGGSGTTVAAGSGGGGSAVIRKSSGAPLVVAGGGGGSGGFQQVSMPISSGDNAPGGNYQTTATAYAPTHASSASPDGVLTVTVSVPGGIGATAGGAGGAAGTPTATAGANTKIFATDVKTGLAGSAWVTGVGGNGAAGVTATMTENYATGTGLVTVATVTSGGGGGGYNGGGSGSAIALSARKSDGSAQGNNHILADGAGGGGGSNYVAGAITSTVTSAGNGAATYDLRNPGSIVISW